MRLCREGLSDGAPDTRPSQARVSPQRKWEGAPSMVGESQESVVSKELGRKELGPCLTGVWRVENWHVVGSWQLDNAAIWPRRCWMWQEPSQLFENDRHSSGEPSCLSACSSVTGIRALQGDEGKEDPMEPRGGPGSGALRECCSQRSGAGTRRGCGLRGGFLSFSFFFLRRLCYCSPFVCCSDSFFRGKVGHSGEERSQGRCRVRKWEREHRSTGRGMGVSREDRMVGLAGGNVGSTGKLSGKSRVWSEEDRKLWLALCPHWSSKPILSTEGCRMESLQLFEDRKSMK